MPDPHHPIDRCPAAARADEEWQCLLARLRAPGHDDARLLRLRQAIASGELQPDARAIAQRMIARYLAS